MPVFKYLKKVVKEKGAGYLPLLDPDRLEPDKLIRMAVQLEKAGVDALLMGSSLLLTATMDTILKRMKEEISIPVIIFPGNFSGG